MRRAVALIIMLLALAGCGNTGPRVAPPVSAASARTSPAALEPVSRPSASVDPYAETAEQFIRRFTSVEARMARTGRSGPFESITDRSCTSCLRELQLYRRIYRDNGWVRGGAESVNWVHRLGPRLWQYHVTIQPTTYAVSATASPRHLSGGTELLEISLRRETGLWKVTWAGVVDGSGKAR